MTLLIAAGCPGTSDETVEPAQALVGSGPYRIMVANDVTKIQTGNETDGVTEIPFLAVIEVGGNDVTPGTVVSGTWGQEVKVKAYYKEGAVLAGLKANEKALSLVPGAPHGAASDYAYESTWYKYSLYRFTMPKKAVMIKGTLADSPSEADLKALEGGAAFNTKLDRLEIAGMTGSFRKSAEGDDAEFDGDT
ncbi:MAG: hypothetical protein LBD86_06715, partial [Spirochaetaceae bacterium]|nr:hypothetical protein [Spirochaetaceae bacterium]